MLPFNLSFFVLQDNNGSIENEELRGFLKDLLELVKKVNVNWKMTFKFKIHINRINYY
jgi:hypothetical protein